MGSNIILSLGMGCFYFPLNFFIVLKSLWSASPLTNRVGRVSEGAHSIYMVAISLKNEKCFDFPQIWWKGR